MNFAFCSEFARNGYSKSPETFGEPLIFTPGGRTRDRAAQRASAGETGNFISCANERKTRRPFVINCPFIVSIAGERGEIRRNKNVSPPYCRRPGVSWRKTRESGCYPAMRDSLLQFAFSSPRPRRASFSPGVVGGKTSVGDRLLC